MVVEKILADGERLPRFPASPAPPATNGSIYLARAGRRARARHARRDLARGIAATAADFDEVLSDAKRRVLDTILASEFNVLARRSRASPPATSARATTPPTGCARRCGSSSSNFPVYRTYVTPAGRRADDRADHRPRPSRRRARDWHGPDADIFDFLRDALTLDLIAPGPRRLQPRARAPLRPQVQQFTGPMMAKSLEDTAFYRYHALLALNEVGGDPAAGALSVDEFHERMAARADMRRTA